MATLKSLRIVIASPRKKKAKGVIETDCYEDDSASSDPYGRDISSEEDDEINDFTYKSPPPCTCDEPQADSNDEIDAKSFDLLSDERRNTCWIKVKQSMPRYFSRSVYKRRIFPAV